MIRTTNNSGNGDATQAFIGPASLTLFLVPSLVWLGGVLLILAAWFAGVDERLVGSLLAIGFVCLTASLVGQAPVATVGRGAIDHLPVAMFASIAFRGGCTLVGVLVLVNIGFLDGPVAAVGCGLWYAFMLTADVWAVSRHLAVNFTASNQTPGRA